MNLPMEYRIVKTKSHYGVYRILKNNGTFERESKPELEAETLEKLQRKISDMNPAFWKPVFVESKNGS